MNNNSFLLSRCGRWGEEEGGARGPSRGRRRGRGCSWGHVLSGLVRENRGGAAHSLLRKNKWVRHLKPPPSRVGHTRPLFPVRPAGHRAPFLPLLPKSFRPSEPLRNVPLSGSCVPQPGHPSSPLGGALPLSWNPSAPTPWFSTRRRAVQGLKWPPRPDSSSSLAVSNAHGLDPCLPFPGTWYGRGGGWAEAKEGPLGSVLGSHCRKLLFSQPLLVSLHLSWASVSPCVEAL